MTQQIDRGHWIEVPSADGQRFGVYRVGPSDVRTDADPNAARPGLVLIQEIWGVNAHIRRVAEQYAEDGFTVLAPDLFWRMQPRVDLGYDEAGSAQAFGFRKALDMEKADVDVRSTVDALKAMDGVDGQVAVVGYCLGGLLAYRAAAGAGIDCAVAYYGGGIQGQLDVASKIDVPIAFHYGAKDTHIPPDAVDSVRQAFAGRDDVRIDVYDGADHGFNCWARPSYSRAAALLAHGRTLAFLATHLR